METAAETKQTPQKEEVAYIEETISVSETAYVYRPFSRPTRKTGLERKFVWKVDSVLIPLLALNYFAAYLDRGSFGNGRLLDLQQDLHMSNRDYVNAAQLFYVGYLVFMIPGNLSLRWVAPNYALGGGVLFFAFWLCIMSTAENVSLVLATRILVGVGQAFVQGIAIYATLWYTRTEAAGRAAFYFGSSTFAGAFSGLISYGIGKNLTEQSTGRSPWRWLFLIEGLIGIFVGLLTVLLLPAFPDRIKNGKHWLFSKEEIDLAIQRSLEWNTQGAKLEKSQVWIALKDPKSWGFCFVQAGGSLVFTSVGIFLPTFIRDFGFSSLDAQLFSVIPYACAMVSLPVISKISDRLNLKGPFLALGFGSAIVGYIILLTGTSTAVKVFATCLITGGVYPATVLNATWCGLNNGGYTKRSTAWGMAEIVGQLWSIMGSNIYESGAPRYVMGHSVVLAFLVFSILNVSWLMLYMNHLNHKKDKVRAEYAARNEVHPHTNRSLEDEHDAHINFIYTL